MFVIRNKKYNELFWSNRWGWGSRLGCSLFDDTEGWNLPLEGEWVEI